MSEESHQIAAHIAQKLRDAGICCEIFDLARTKPGVLRRDRIVVALALSLLTALAWSYLLWLSADMSMGGMDMTGFRMIPSGMGLMVPVDAPWRAMEFVLDRGAGTTYCNRLVRYRLLLCMDRFLAVCHLAAMGT